MTYTMILDHLILVLAALLLAVIIGLPLGLLIYLKPKAGKVVLRVVDLIQTTPALALLGIIMVFMGAGKPTAVVGLALYSLLPIVRNTSLGLSQVSPGLKEAAVGMGMTPAYRLLHVELPLAMPMLFTGLRIAAANAIGTAVFAATVSGGGLGNIINNGIRQQNMQLLLSGTLALMCMALVLDVFMGVVERRLSDPSRKKLPRWAHVGGGVALALVSLALAGAVMFPQSTGGLVLYDGDYSEVKLMHSMVKQLVEDRTDLSVTIRDPMTQVNNFKELRRDEPSCDLMFSYDGTVLTTFMGQDVSDIPEGKDLYTYISELLLSETGIQILPKVGLNNTYAMGVTQDVVDRYGVKTISDLTPIAPELVLGGEHEFFTAEGSMKYQPFVDFYGLNFRRFVPIDVSLKYTAVEKGEFDVMVVYATDGLNKRANLTILEDDRSFFPAYNGAFLVRKGLFEDFAESAPDLREVLELLNGKVDNNAMVALTYAVDVEGQSVDQAAHDFLVEQGLLSN